MLWWQIALIIFTSVVVGILVGKLVGYVIARIQKKPLLKKHETREVVQQQIKPTTAPELLNEIENNHRIASDLWTGKLLPFQTHVWDSGKHNIVDLTANLREDLIQAYTDMSLANNIVWLATDLGRRSDGLDEHYVKLCQKVATRLDRILSLLKRPSVEN
ncbi:MAG: hypothetical protein KAV87_04710 [Desulfobacteraceae bacterium]|nr:hypothetical protein [Desulfobacteraceae bacterium]